MRAVIQRVSSAAVAVDGACIGSIATGLLVLLGVGPQDDDQDVAWLAGKIARLRIFADEAGKMNRSVVDIAGGCLVISQFTLFAEVAQGNRPSFTAAAAPALAQELYGRFCAALGEHLGRPVERGRFAADMQVSLVNDGPVTITIDSRRRE